MNNNCEGYKPFLPEATIKGNVGYYPITTEEDWKKLPLPIRCATWYDDLESVIFDTWFENYKIRATVEIHPQNAFKTLFTLSNNGTQLYSVCGVRFKNGKRAFAKWYQDTTSGAFAIIGNRGHIFGQQGGYRQHIPANVKIMEDGTYQLNCGNAAEPGTHCHFD